MSIADDIHFIGRIVFHFNVEKNVNLYKKYCYCNIRSFNFNVKINKTFEEKYVNDIMQKIFKNNEPWKVLFKKSIEVKKNNNFFPI